MNHWGRGDKYADLEAESLGYFLPALFCDMDIPWYHNIPWYLPVNIYKVFIKDPMESMESNNCNSEAWISHLVQDMVSSTCFRTADNILGMDFEKESAKARTDVVATNRINQVWRGLINSEEQTIQNGS